ncbi:MAG: histidine--tRNA ligase [Ardenticatenia bacterium]|nr:histidine--tRNA ligase [Ardenticatenia bacterium]
MSKPGAPALARGMRDLLPLEARRHQKVTDTLRGIFERHGYAPIETPALELEGTLMGKYGPDAERLIYRAGLAGESGYALRYDLSVPLARTCAMNPALTKPFRRYQMAAVWRGERPQRGRYREFMQADIDLVGSTGVLADAEIIQIVVQALQALGLPRSLTKINDRRVLNGIGRFAGMPAELLPGLYRAIDKLDKIGFAGVRQELLAVGLSGDLLNRQRQAVERWLGGKADRATLEVDLAKADDEGVGEAARGLAIAAFLDALSAFPQNAATPLSEARQTAIQASLDVLRSQTSVDRIIPSAVTERLLDLLALRDRPLPLLDALDRRLDDAEATAGTADLRRILAVLDAVGIGEDRYQVDFAMVRGLAYYNGSIFETVVPEPPIGSVSGGGRYDGLIGLFGRDMPAVGSSLGVDRLVDVMVELGLFDDPDLIPPTAYMTLFSPDDAPAAAARANSLRAAGLNVILATEPGQGLGQQLRSADQLGCRWALIVGPDEVAAGEVTVKDLRQSRQSQVAEANLLTWLRREVAPQIEEPSP